MANFVDPDAPLIQNGKLLNLPKTKQYDNPVNQSQMVYTMFGDTDITRADFELNTSSQLAKTKFIHEKFQLYKKAIEFSKNLLKKDKLLMSAQAQNDLETPDTCYICGLPIKSKKFKLEIEHILPISMAMQYHAIVSRDLPDLNSMEFDKDGNLRLETIKKSKVPLKLKKGDIVYTANEVNLLCLEVRNSHQCCNQIKTNTVFIKQSDKQWIVDKNGLNTYLETLWNPPAESYQNKGCNKTFIKFLQQAYSNDGKEGFIQKRLDYMTINYFKPICEILNKLPTSGRSIGNPGFKLLLRISNFAEYLTDVDFNAAVRSMKKDERRKEKQFTNYTIENLYIAVSQYIQNTFKDKDVLSKFSSECEKIANTRPKLVQKVNTMNTNEGRKTRVSKSQMKQTIDNCVNKGYLKEAIHLYSVVFVKKNDGKYTDKSYIDDIQKNKVMDGIINVFLMLMESFVSNNEFFTDFTINIYPESIVSRTDIIHVKNEEKELKDIKDAFIEALEKQNLIEVGNTMLELRDESKSKMRELVSVAETLLNNTKKRSRSASKSASTSASTSASKSASKSASTSASTSRKKPQMSNMKPKSSRSTKKRRRRTVSTKYN